MTRESFILLALLYYAFSILVIIGIFALFNNRTKKRYQKEIDELERSKNLIISATILSELNKVESLAKNKDLKKKFSSWKKRFDEIKDNGMSGITDEINSIETLFIDKNYKELKKVILECELNLNMLKTKSDILLEEIK